MKDSFDPVRGSGPLSLTLKLLSGLIYLAGLLDFYWLEFQKITNLGTYVFEEIIFSNTGR